MGVSDVSGCIASVYPERAAIFLATLSYQTQSRSQYTLRTLQSSTSLRDAPVQYYSGSKHLRSQGEWGRPIFIEFLSKINFPSTSITIHHQISGLP